MPRIVHLFGLEKPVFRIAVNTMATLGAIGLTTKIMPSLTLGSGGIGGAVTGDNITVYHLFNVKRLAFEAVAPPEEALRPGMVPAGPIKGPDSQRVAAVVEEVVHEILKA